MTSFFTYRPSSTSITGRIMTGMCLLGFGWMGYAVIQFAFNPVDYTATQFTQVLLYEWLPVAKPIFLALVPTIFLALMEIFQHTSRRQLLLIAVAVGIMLTMPAYQYNLRRWQPLVRTIRGLPLRQVNYHRHAGTLDSPAGMGITFITPKESFLGIKNRFKTQFAANKNMLLWYRLEGSYPLSADYLVSETSEGEIEVTLYVYPLFQGYDY